MNNLHLALDIPNEIFRDPFTVQSFSLKRRHVLIPVIHLNFSILSLLNKLDLNIFQSELLYTPPDYFTDVRRDYTSSNSNDITKINWVLDGKDSHMNWYNTSTNQHVRSVSNAVDGDVYKGYNLSECTIISSSDLSKPSLVQAGVPHNVVTHDEPRWAIALTLFDRITKQHAKFSDVADRFSQYIIK